MWLHRFARFCVFSRTPRFLIALRLYNRTRLSENGERLFIRAANTMSLFSFRVGRVALGQQAFAAIDTLDQQRFDIILLLLRE